MLNVSKAVLGSKPGILPLMLLIILVLAGDVITDVAITGGGITGITAAYLLGKPGFSINILT